MAFAFHVLSSNLKNISYNGCNGDILSQKKKF